MTDFTTILEERGLIHDSTDINALRAISKANGIHLYIGFDLTADSLHIGSLIQLMVARWALQTGNKVTALLGDFTTTIGDPTGRTSARPVLTEDQIHQNSIGILENINSIVRLGSGWDLLTVERNSSLSKDYSFAEFMDSIATNISANRLVNLKFISDRLETEQPLTLAEMLYPVIQGMDFLSLFDIGVNLQVGGSDQWTNMLQGVNLIKKIHDRDAHALTTPLLTNAAGDKMGKSVGGAVWLAKAKLHPNDFFQFWRNIEDTRVELFFKLLTQLPLVEIERHMAGDINEAKIVLAENITALVHGEAAGKVAKKHAATLFGAVEDINSVEAHMVDWLDVLSVIIVSLMKCSKSEARRLITQNAVKINDNTIKEDLIINELISSGDKFVLGVGKKKKFVCQVR
jgi:tyrosyl-tRNA synthetase